MRLAILSDIHGNPLALDAVLSDIQGQGEVDAYWVMGDFTALGYDPVTPVLATCDIHSKNRDKCQEHHEGTTLSYWLQESCIEKREHLSS